MDPGRWRGDRRGTSRAPTSPGATAATDVVDDDALPRPACPAAPPISPRSRWHGHPDYHPEVHRPSTRWGRPEPPAPEPEPEPEPAAGPAPQRVPRKLTVTRVAALRSREITENGIRAFHRAATADGADRSGLTALTYATMMTYAVDAAVAVALANTLFFAAATAESRTNVALYLAITVAPFAVVAPVIGPLLDRLQRGRRAALAVSFGGRAVLAVVMAFGYDSWVLYPAALGAMVLSKSFVVLKAAVTPRVLPEAITLVTTNSRLTTFGLASGAVFGGVAAGVAAVWGSPGALFFTALLGVAGVVLCLRIPAWVEVTEGEVPATLHESDDEAAPDPAPAQAASARRWGARCIVALWGNGATRVLTGFLTLFVAFVVKAQTETEPTRQLVLIGVVGAAAGAGVVRRQRDRLPSAVRPLRRAGPVRRRHRRGRRGRRGRPPRHRHGRRHRAGRGDLQRAGQGRAGRGGAARPARAVPRLGVRPLGDGPAAGLGVRRGTRRPAPPRHLPAGLRDRRRGAGARRGPDGPRRPRPHPAALPGRRHARRRTADRESCVPHASRAFRTRVSTTCFGGT